MFSCINTNGSVTSQKLSAFEKHSFEQIKLALRRGDFEMVKMIAAGLQQQGISTSLKMINNQQRSLLKIINFKDLPSRAFPLLFCAVRYNRIEAVKWLVENGADITVTIHHKGQNVDIILFAEIWERTEILKYFEELSQGKEKEIDDYKNNCIEVNPIEYGMLFKSAILTQDVSQLQFLCSSRVTRDYINQVLDSVGFTPLHFAIKNGSNEIITMLLNAGADPDKQTFTQEGSPCITARQLANALNIVLPEMYPIRVYSINELGLSSPRLRRILPRPPVLSTPLAFPQHSASERQRTPYHSSAFFTTEGGSSSFPATMLNEDNSSTNRSSSSATLQSSPFYDETTLENDANYWVRLFMTSTS